jgi:hypothetical protein
MELLIEGNFVLEKFPGKGGWTFVRVPIEILASRNYFGMIRICGRIDQYEFEGKHLMPMGNGFVFLPISKPIRTAIGKEQGDSVRLELMREAVPSQIPEELIDCLNDDPGKLHLFEKLAKSDQKRWIEYIYSANSPEVKADRIVKLLFELNQTGLKFNN